MIMYLLFLESKGGERKGKKAVSEKKANIEK